MVASNEVTFYTLHDGVLFVACQEQAGLFKLLTKLGVKSAPNNILAVMTSTQMQAGTYTVSYGQTTTTFTMTHSLPHPKLTVPKVEKFSNKPSRDDRRQWRESMKRHGRNTGRNC